MRDRTFVLGVVLATFFLVLLNLPSSVSSSLRGFFRGSMATYQGGVTRFVSRVHQTSSAVGNISEVIQERDQLAKEVGVLRAQLRGLDGVMRENGELRTLTGFKKQSNLRTVACEVIARDDGYGWWQTIRLDKGRNEGLAADMPVITPEGLVGRIIEVNGHTCDVLLISDRSFKVSVRFEQDGSFGILQGGGISLRGEHRFGVLCMPSPARVDYIRKDLEIKAGEMVVSSGFGGVFPAGLVVGRVVGVRLDDTGLFQVAEVEPAADLARLQRVLVVTGP
ncbi:MAG: rod shape-determining protein MreC [bacterium]